MPELTLPQRNLAAQVGVRNCALVLATTGKVPGENPLHAYERSLTVDDMGAPLLAELGVLRDDGYDRGYCLAVPQDRVAQTIRAYPDLAVKYDALLSAFFQFITNKLGGYPTTRAPFDPPANWPALTEALLKNALLERQGTKMRWTDAAAPWMEASGHWRDGVSKFDRFRADTKDRADALWHDMPLLVRMHLRRQARKQPGFMLIRTISRHHYDGRWHLKPLPDTGKVHYGEIGLPALESLLHRLRDK